VARPEFRTYEEFFPWYVAMHSVRGTRLLHLTGTLLGASTAVLGFAATRKLRALAAFPLFGYGFAWPAHFLVEKNNPATFGYPRWSLRGDMQMVAMMLRGEDATLQEIADSWLAEHPGDRVIVLPESQTTPF
jgi:hypothetical protein